MKAKKNKLHILFLGRRKSWCIPYIQQVRALKNDSHDLLICIWCRLEVFKRTILQDVNA
jgi:hypothetical protein